MSTNPALTIIVPVYNEEKILKQIFASFNAIKEKNRHKVELVLVNDGSTDSSQSTLEDFAHDTQSFLVKVINKENGGTASALNSGLEVSTGEWIIFIGADDEIAFDPIDFIEKYYDSTAMGFTIEFYKQKKLIQKYRPAAVNKINHLDILTSKNPYFPPALMIRKDSIQFPFETEIKFREDWIFLMVNHLIFDNLKTFPDIVSARINSHGDNKSSNQLKTGEFREKIATKMLDELADKLTSKQKNNLLIQQEIGKIQQKKPKSFSVFFNVPCSLDLYLKLIIYFFLQRLNDKIGQYAK